MTCEIVGASSTLDFAKAAISPTGWLWRTETWHWPQQSREENWGPDVCCDLRQQLALLTLQQHGASLESAANAWNGIGWANRNATSAVANQRARRGDITPSIRRNRAETSVKHSRESRNPSRNLKAPELYDDTPIELSRSKPFAFRQAEKSVHPPRRAASQNGRRDDEESGRSLVDPGDAQRDAPTE